MHATTTTRPSLSCHSASSPTRSCVVRGLALTLPLLWHALLASPVCAQPASFEEAAAAARQSVVTVRIALPIAPDAAADDEPEASDPAFEPDASEDGEAEDKPAGQVTVCTGVAVGKHLIVTSAFASSDAQIGVTTPLGRRASAAVRVLDEYSGLALLEVEDLELAPLETADEAPAIGAWALGAAGWGAESPVVSFGVISGVDRQQPGYPPLLQCDLRTVETSSGAALLNIEGELLGVVVAVDPASPSRGWTYGVPASHVDRLIRTLEERRQDADAAGGADEPTAGNAPGAEVIVLRKRRPEAGLVLRDNGQRQIFVQRVRQDSPAERAGFATGDEVLAVGGVQIRSVYEAVRPVLNRQPGDTLTYRVRNEQGDRDVTLVLGGGVELPSPSLRQISSLVRPKLDIQGLPSGIRSTAPDRVRQFVADDGQEIRQAPTVEDKLELLERALDRYRTVIALQQQELREAEQARRQDQKALEELRRQLGMDE